MKVMSSWNIKYSKGVRKDVKLSHKVVFTQLHWIARKKFKQVH